MRVSKFVWPVALLSIILMLTNRSVVLAQTSANPRATVTQSTNISLGDLEAKINALQLQLNRLNRVDQMLGSKMSRDQTEVNNDTSSVQDFREHESAFMAYSSDLSTKIAWLLGGLGIAVTVAGIGATVWITLTTRTKIEGEMAKFDAEVVRMKVEHGQRIVEAGRAADKAHHGANLAQQDANKIREILGEVQKTRDDARSYAEGMQSYVDRIRKDTITKLSAQSIDAQLEGRVLTSVDSARLRSNADTLAMFPGKTPFEKAYEQGLIEEGRKNSAAALKAFTDAAAVASDPLEKAKSLYAQAAVRVLIGDDAPDKSLSDPVQLLDQVISLQASLLTIPEGESVLAKAHIVHAELLRKREEWRGAMAGYTWIIDRFPDTEDLVLQQLYAIAEVQSGVLLENEGEGERERAKQRFDDVISRFESATDSTLRRQVASAAYHKGRILMGASAMGDAAKVFTMTLQFLDDPTDKLGRKMAAEARRLRDEALAKAHGLTS